MGCASSSSAGVTPEEEAEKAAAQQRRRLSVAPQHVGDVTTEGTAHNARKDEKLQDEDMTEEEKKALENLSCAYKSRKGVVPYNKKKVNQDRAVVKYALNGDPDVCLFGVMDGHGEFGHLVSEFVQKNLPVRMAEQENITTNTEEAILNGMAATVADLADTDINCAFSGTTCVGSILIKRRLLTYNVGDSRCVVVRQIKGGRIEAIGLSEDQKPDNPQEKARILKAGGRVEPLPGAPGEDRGPMRVWLAQVDVPGLAMSRSIGDDVSQTVGVTSIPEISTHDLTENDVFVIWASDGVWEFISNEQAAEIVWKNRTNLKKAVTALVDESTKRWRAEEEVVDDITCVIVQFNAVNENL
jgi:serine/threonine protein phosphatase PrpC